MMHFRHSCMSNLDTQINALRDLEDLFYSTHDFSRVSSSYTLSQQWIRIICPHVFILLAPLFVFCEILSLIFHILFFFS